MAAGSTVVDFRCVIESKLTAKKDELDQTEECLKKYTSLDRSRGTNDRLPSFRGRLGSAVNRRDQNDRVPMLGSRLGPRIEVRNGEEDGEDEEEGGGHDAPLAALSNRSVMSRIVVEQKTREDALAEQKVDKNEKMRNRRMFGSILGTLQKFRADENKLKDREQKKREIEKKIDIKTEKEREDAKKEKRELFLNKRKGERELKVLQLQMQRVEEFEIWEKNKRKEQHFIKTKLGPKAIFYLPKTHNESTISALEETMDIIDKEIAEAREAFDAELSKLSAKAEDLSVNLDDLEANGGEEDDEAYKRGSMFSTVIKPAPSDASGQQPRSREGKPLDSHHTEDYADVRTWESDTAFRDHSKEGKTELLGEDGVTDSSLSKRGIDHRSFHRMPPTDHPASHEEHVHGHTRIVKGSEGASNGHGFTNPVDPEVAKKEALSSKKKPSSYGNGRKKAGSPGAVNDATSQDTNAHEEEEEEALHRPNRRVKGSPQGNEKEKKKDLRQKAGRDSKKGKDRGDGPEDSDKGRSSSSSSDSSAPSPKRSKRRSKSSSSSSSDDSDSEESSSSSASTSSDSSDSESSSSSSEEEGRKRRRGKREAPDGKKETRSNEPKKRRLQKKVAEGKKYKGGKKPKGSSSSDDD